MPGHDFFYKIRSAKTFYVFTHTVYFPSLTAPSIQQEIFHKTLLFDVISDLWEWVCLHSLATSFVHSKRTM